MLVPQGLQSAFEDTGIQAESHEFMESGLTMALIISVVQARYLLVTESHSVAG